MRECFIRPACACASVCLYALWEQSKIYGIRFKFILFWQAKNWSNLFKFCVNIWVWNVMLASEMFTFQKFWAISHILSQYADLSDMSEYMAIQPNVFWFTSIYTFYAFAYAWFCLFHFSFAANFMCLHVCFAVHRCALFAHCYKETRLLRWWFRGKKRNGKKPNILCMYNMYRFFCLFDSWFLVRAFTR